MPLKSMLSRFCSLLLLLLGLCHCQTLECGGQLPTLNAHAPMLVNMRLFEQLQNDPWRIILAVDFISYDGSLGNGTLELYSNNSPTPILTPSLASLFASSGGLSLNSSSGTLALPLRLSPTTPNGAELAISTQLIDANNNRSNCYQMNFDFTLND